MCRVIAAVSLCLCCELWWQVVHVHRSPPLIWSGTCHRPVHCVHPSSSRAAAAQSWTAAVDVYGDVVLGPKKKGYRKYSNLEKFIASLNLKMGLYESNQRGIACSFGSQSVWKGFKQVSWPRLFCLQGILQAGVKRNIVIYMIFCNTEAFPEYSNSCLGQIGLIYLFF